MLAGFLCERLHALIAAFVVRFGGLHDCRAHGWGDIEQTGAIRHPLFGERREKSSLQCDPLLRIAGAFDRLDSDRLRLGETGLRGLQVHVGKRFHSFKHRAGERENASAFAFCAAVI
nr:hypothetical protein [Paraburkholderia nodosa]